MKISVGIIGVTGYAGAELLKILLRHPAVSLQYLGARQLEGPCPVGDLLPAFRNDTSVKVQPFRLEEAVSSCDLLFLALPHGVAMGWVPRILRKKKAKVIDLSGDFRLRSAPLFEQAYHLKHSHPDLLGKAVYGLTEWARKELPSTRLVANPGCYPTATLLGLAPLVKAGLLGNEGLIVDAKSGVTGAGRSLKEDLLFSEVNEDLRAYRVNAHQHIPEMEQELSRLASRAVRMTFVPHLVPINRGLYATVYAPLRKSISGSQLRSIYCKAYGGEPFIRLLPEGTWPQIKSVAGTNFCDIGITPDKSQKKRAIIVSAIDNLGKGAAGQAVQNMNRLYSLPETQGLT